MAAKAPRAIQPHAAPNAFPIAAHTAMPTMIVAARAIVPTAIASSGVSFFICLPFC